MAAALQLNSFDRVISWFNPVAGARRLAARAALAPYEGVKKSRLRRLAGTEQSPNKLVEQNAEALREQARHFDRNHDVAGHALDVLVRFCIGADGVGVDPIPRSNEGKIHTEFAAELLALWREWCERPDVTHQFDFAQVQRLMGRTWLRDGEALSQSLVGRVSGLDHGTRVPFSLEMIEPDLLPLDLRGVPDNVKQSIELSPWGRPLKYWFLKKHPSEISGMPTSADFRKVAAERVRHIFVPQRISQRRGLSIFTRVITRFEDCKDYEESERIAAKVAASMAAFIIKGNPDSYTGGQDTPGATPSDYREMQFTPGMIFDDLMPGESVGTIDSKRPNPNADLFVSGQYRRAAGGLNVSNSSMMSSYKEGSYSAQRQEMAEAFAGYRIVTKDFVARFVRPMWQEFVDVAILSGAIKVPADVDVHSIKRAVFVGPAMPQIDPLKESNARKAAERAGHATATQHVRERGGTLAEVLETRQYETELQKAYGVISDANPAHDLGREQANEGTGNAE